MIGMESAAVKHDFHSVLMELDNKTDVGWGVGNGTLNYNNKLKRNSEYVLNVPHLDYKLCFWPVVQPKPPETHMHRIIAAMTNKWKKD